MLSKSGWSSQQEMVSGMSVENVYNYRQFRHLARQRLLYRSRLSPLAYALLAVFVLTAFVLVLLGVKQKPRHHYDPNVAESRHTATTKHSIGSLDSHLESNIPHNENDEKYVIVIDGGSTGTRAHVFKSDQSEAGAELLLTTKSDAAMAELASTDPKVSGSCEKELQKILQQAVRQIRFQMSQTRGSAHQILGVFMLGTAGFRLLKPEEQLLAQRVAKAVCQRTMKAELQLDAHNNFPLQFIGNIRVGILSGNEEAILAWESTEAISLRNDKQQRTGIIEAGGTSVQVVVPYPKDQVDDHNGVPRLYVKSYMGIGAHSIESKLNSELVRDQVASRHLESLAPAQVGIRSPCGFVGYSESKKINVTPSQMIQAELSFSGDFDSCLAAIMYQLDHIDAESMQAVYSIPEKLSNDVHFMCLALFYHVTNFINISTQKLDSFPYVSPSSLVEAGRHLCTIPWTVLNGKYRNIDPNTPPNRLSGRCFDIALITALLKRFGIGGNNGSTIELTQRIGKTDIDWTVGVALNAFNGNDIEFGRETGLVLGKYRL